MFVRIYNPNDRAIRRRVFPLERKTRFLSPTPKNQFTYACAGGIYRDQRFALWRQIFVERLDDEQLAALERVVLNSCDNSSNYSCQLHIS